MSSQHLVVYPRDWCYRPDPQKVVEAIHLLQREGVMGGPLPLTSRVEAVYWRPGLRLEAQLGIRHTEGFGYVEVCMTNTIQIHVHFGMEATCPACGMKADRWSDLLDDLATTEQDPAFRCDCGHVTTLTALRFDPPLGLGYFSIEFADVGPEADTRKRLWHELERVVGTALTYTVTRY